MTSCLMSSRIIELAVEIVDLVCELDLDPELRP